MTEQLTIDGDAVELVDGRELRPRQQAAWDVVRTSGGATADEVGANWHAVNRKHGPDVRCRFCGDDGESVLRSKALARLVIRRRNGVWEPRNPADAAPRSQPLREPTEAELAANPFAGLGRDSTAVQTCEGDASEATA